MGLVDYPDSEEESPDGTQASLSAANADASTKLPASRRNEPAFQKVVNRDNTIQISLPHSTTPDGNASTVEEEVGPPTKRARTSGAFSGFGSLLPAPRNPVSAKVNTVTNSGGSILAQSRGSGLARGVSLKTGTTPAFSRVLDDEVEEQESTQEIEKRTGNSDKPELLGENTESNSLRNGASMSKSEQKPSAKAVVFKPLSVSRKPQKKKPPGIASSQTSMTTGVERASTVRDKRTDHDSQAPVTKPKASLFSSGIDDQETPPMRKTHGEYQPLLDDEQEEVDPDNSQSSSVAVASQAPTIFESQTPKNDLDTLANSLGLSTAERRQLFGRGGNSIDAKVAHISMAKEYAHNRELRENEELMPSNNPVRSIAPGKHSLQQLVNAAQSNKEALEESFARGKSNKKDAGSRYGW